MYLVELIIVKFLHKRREKDAKERSCGKKRGPS